MCFTEPCPHHLLDSSSLSPPPARLQALEAPLGQLEALSNHI